MIDYAYEKIGNASGVLDFPDAPAPAPFTFSFSSGNITFPKTGEVWTKGAAPVAPLHSCKRLGCNNPFDPNARCQCWSGCTTNGDCCPVRF